MILACGQLGPPFHILTDCPVVKEQQPPRELPEHQIWDGKGKSDLERKVSHPAPDDSLPLRGV